MKPEQIHDALNSLDDRLIEETDRLRNRKRPSQWKKWTAMAACLCLVALGTAAAFALNRGGTEKTEAASRDTVQEAMEETKEMAAASVAPEDREEMEEAMQECAEEFRVRILRWKEDGFLGEVTAAGDTDCAPGSRVEIRISASEEDKKQFPADSQVCPVIMEPETWKDVQETESIPVFYAAELLPCD